MTRAQQIAFLIVTAPLAMPARAAEPTAEDLIKALDRNMVFESRVADLRMVITKEGKQNEKALHMRSRGWETAFVSFVAPARDKGTRYLKLEKNLWMYLPGAEKQIKISGHMLRQSLMGSDFSYEDMLESPDLAARYEPSLSGDEAVDGRPCAVVTLKGKVPDLTYPSRKVWIDRATNVPVKEDLYALTGKLMKQQLFFDVKEFQDKDRTRHYPTRIVMKNLLQQGTETEIHLDNVTFGTPIPDNVFTLQNLGKGN